jgi:hypothetical protein
MSAKGNDDTGRRSTAIIDNAPGTTRRQGHPIAADRSSFPTSKVHPHRSAA